MISPLMMSLLHETRPRGGADPRGDRRPYGRMFAALYGQIIERYRMKQIVRYIDRIDQLLSDPEKWTQKAFARAADGAIVVPGSRSAQCWCLIGAIMKVTNRNCDDHLLVVDFFVRTMRGAVDNSSCWRYNDGADFPTIKRWISDARDLAKAA